MACREMGFPNATAVNHSMRFRNVTGTIHQYDVNCTGIENGLPSCQRIETVEGECTGTHGEGVVLLCAPRGNPVFNDNSLNYNSLEQGPGRWFTTLLIWQTLIATITLTAFITQAHVSAW